MKTQRKLTPYERAIASGALTLEESIDKHIGKLGMEKRDKFEFELSIEILAEKLKQLRNHKKVTQEEMAKKMGYKNKSQISRLEKADSPASINAYIKAFDELGFSIIINVMEKEPAKKSKLQKA